MEYTQPLWLYLSGFSSLYVNVQPTTLKISWWRNISFILLCVKNFDDPLICIIIINVCLNSFPLTSQVIISSRLFTKGLRKYQYPGISRFIFFINNLRANIYGFDISYFAFNSSLAITNVEPSVLILVTWC